MKHQILLRLHLDNYKKKRPIVSVCDTINYKTKRFKRKRQTVEKKETIKLDFSLCFSHVKRAL